MPNPDQIHDAVRDKLASIATTVLPNIMQKHNTCTALAMSADGEPICLSGHDWIDEDISVTAGEITSAEVHDPEGNVIWESDHLPDFGARANLMTEREIAELEEAYRQKRTEPQRKLIRQKNRAKNKQAAKSRAKNRKK